MATFSELANPWVSGLAVYEPGKPIDAVARELGFEDVLAIHKLASNENALGPSPLAVEALRAAAAQVHLYPDGGAYYLRQAIAAAHRLDPSQVLPVNGSNEALELIGHVFLDRRKGIVMSDHAFVVYRLVAMAARASVVSVPMRAFTHDLDAMLASIRPETRVVFVANPNNPTGTMVSGYAIDRFMDKVPCNVVVCFDEAYVELVDPLHQPDTLRYVREGRNVIVLRTFSKTYGLAGLRIGYAVAPEACISLLNRVRQPFNVNAPAMAAAMAALRDANHVRRTREMVRAGLEYLMSGFRAMDLEYVPSVANFILVKVGKGRNVFQALQAKGYIVRPMDGYGLCEYIRVTVGTRDQNEGFLRALGDVLERSEMP
jgi:histidinol-phosphate aminotransferase